MTTPTQTVIAQPIECTLCVHPVGERGAVFSSVFFYMSHYLIKHTRVTAPVADPSTTDPRLAGPVYRCACARQTKGDFGTMQHALMKHAIIARPCSGQAGVVV